MKSKERKFVEAIKQYREVIIKKFKMTFPKVGKITGEVNRISGTNTIDFDIKYYRNRKLADNWKVSGWIGDTFVITDNEKRVEIKIDIGEVTLGK